ncbi:isochorismatase family protein [Thalassospira lucentensis]|uniref:isochorismatase family protein n=1 Tax=Thalassospira lucentensis TaxID=168935 RepID=UPI00142D852A|nr:isochorismatase family protein [Thalassospira lucentensis]NIZ03960.1 isochorismatase family protein [Thalassospira lucentensis]
MSLPDFETPLGTDTALIVLDVQKAIDNPRWNSKNNPGYIDAIAKLLKAFRAANLPIIHIRHEEANPASSFYVNGLGQPFKDEALPVDGETVITKTVNCAFIGTDLEQHLRDRGIERLIFTGVVIHNSMDVSIRAAHCLGFDCHLPLDATTAIDVTDTNGKTFAAQDVFDLYAAVLASEYCTLTQSKNVITALPG